MNKKILCIMACASIFAFSAKTPSLKETSSCAHCGNGLSNAFVNVVKQSREAVVYIETKYSRPSGRERAIDPYEQFQGDLLEKFFGGSGRPERRRKAPHGSGTGFIVSSDGYIVTNHHVIKDATEIIVEKYGDDGEKEYKATLVGCDPRTDIAVIKIEEKELPYLEFANSDEIEQGQWIVAIGHPLRLRDSVTAGVVSAKHRMNLQISQLEDFVQTDASLNPGSSGSPLLNLRGEVIAVNTAIIPPSSQNMGVGFSVPSNIAKMVYEHVKITGTVNRGFLGVSLQDLNEDLIEGFGYKKGTKGSLITSVAKDSAGEIAGLCPGDLVVSFNGNNIKNSSTFQMAVGKLPAGEACNLTVLRNNKQVKLKVTLGSSMPEKSEEGDIIHKLGVIVEEITESSAQKYHLKSGENGVVIKEIVEGSLAHRSGWKAGSVIMVVNGDKINNVEDLSKALKKTESGKKLVALLNHKGAALFTSITTP